MTSLWILVSATLCATVVYGSEPINLGPIASKGTFGTVSENQNTTDKDQTASANARFRLEKLRPYFSIGLGGIPILEPYTVTEPVPTVVNDHEIKALINYYNFTVHGLQSFIVQKLEVHLEAMRLDFKFYFHELLGDVFYGADLQVDAANNLLVGKLNATLYNVLLEGAYQFAPTNNGHLEIKGLKYHILSRGVQYNLQDVLVTSGFRSKRSVPASELSKVIATAIAQVTADSIAETTVREINTHILKHYTKAQILRLLIPDEE